MRNLDFEEGMKTNNVDDMNKGGVQERRKKY